MRPFTLRGHPGSNIVSKGSLEANATKLEPPGCYSIKFRTWLLFGVVPNVGELCHAGPFLGMLNLSLPSIHEATLRRMRSLDGQELYGRSILIVCEASWGVSVLVSALLV